MSRDVIMPPSPTAPTAITSAKPGKSRAGFNWPGLWFVVGLLVVWEALTGTGLVALSYLPSPHAIVMALFELIGMGEFFPAFLHTLWSTLQGWFLGGVLGLVLGLAIGASAWTWRFGMASVDLLRAIPAVTLVPVAALLFGFSLEMELFVTTYAALWPTLVNTIDGVRGTTEMHLQVGRMMHLSGIRRALSVSLPSAAGSIIVGLRLSLSLSLMLAVAAELVGNPAGMGYGLLMTQQALRPDRMFVYILAIGLLGMLLNWLFGLVTRILFPGIMVNLNEGGDK